MSETPAYTDTSTAAQIDREMQPPYVPARIVTRVIPECPGTCTFTLTPYGQVHVKVVDHGYPREAIIETSQLIRHVLRADELGFEILDHTR